MKKLLLFFVLVSCGFNAHAAGGIWEYYLNIGTTWYGNQGSNIPLHNASLASNLNLNTDVLNITTRGINTWNDGGCDVTSSNFNYRVYKQGDTPPSFIPESLTYQSQSGNNKFWNNNSPVINLLSGLTDDGTYVFEVYFDALTNGQGGCPPVLYENNGGGNFIANFTVGVALPVKYLALNVSKLNNNQNEISWTTLTEVNNDYFEVQHSKDGINFDLIGMVIGNGTSNREKDYSFIHKITFPHLHYYRLKQVDYDGKYEFSPIVSIIKNSENDVNIYPNPTQGVLNLTGIDDKSSVIIYDLRGMQIRKFQNLFQSIIDIQDLDMGIYLVSIVNSQTNHFFRIVKE